MNFYHLSSVSILNLYDAITYQHFFLLQLWEEQLLILDECTCKSMYK